MTESASVCLDPVFPLYLRINDQGVICGVSERLAEHIGVEAVGRHFAVAFNIVRPLLNNTEQPLSGFQNQLFLFRTPNDTFAMRGELKKLPELNGDMLMLVTPWLTWMLEHQPAVLLPANCFPAADAQIDLQIYLGSQTMVMDDLHKILSQLKRAKTRATLASDAKSRFINHVSHELRTPLNGITGAVELLGQNEVSQESLSLIEVMKKSSAALLTVINQILDYSNSVSGSGEVQLSIFNPADICQDVMDIVTVEAFRNNAQMILRPATRSNMSLSGDAVKIKNILLSLVANAIKHGSPGEVVIEYRVNAQADGDQTELTIEVRDSGPGLEAELREKFFEEPAADQAGLPGDGLGLWVAQTGIRLMGGELGVKDNDSGAGCCFWFTVPVKRLTDTQTSRLQQEAAALPQTRSILLVDDNPVNLKLAKLQLQRLGMSVDTAGSGEEALTKCRVEVFSLVLMDIQMPRLSGIDTARLLQEQSSYRDIPIVAWTANASESERSQFKAAGMTDILPKPTSKEMFSALLRKTFPLTTFH